jgi:hypothetical protein
MNIITGRGNNRKALEFPCARIVKQSSPEEQRQGLALLCDILNIRSPAKALKAA